MEQKGNGEQHRQIAKCILAFPFSVFWIEEDLGKQFNVAKHLWQ